MGFVETGVWQSGIVADEGTTSAEIDLGHICAEAVVYVPTIDNATVAIYIATASAGTFAALKLTNVDGTEEALLAGASTGGFFWRIPLGARYMKIVCGAAQSNGPRTFQVLGL
jgi:hypothetical protein